jgi:hypothetical protein
MKDLRFGSQCLRSLVDVYRRLGEKWRIHFREDVDKYRENVKEFCNWQIGS